MDLNAINTQFTNLLNDHFTIQLAKTYLVDSSQLKPIELVTQSVVGIEFVINHTMRLHIFGINKDGTLKFTRPKEGIKKYILQELREYDFYFTMDDRLSARYNLFARIIDTWLTFEASEYIKKTLSFWKSESGNNLDYCLGYKILYNHRYTKTFDASFEVLVNKGSSYHEYTGHIRNGELHEIWDEDKNVVSPEKIFEV